MQITIVKSDNFVSVDGVQKEMDLSFLPTDFHALQFNGSGGFVESNNIDKSKTFDAITKWENWAEFDAKLKTASNKPNPVEIVEAEEEVEEEPPTEEEVLLIWRELRNFLLQESDVFILRAFEEGKTPDTKVVEYRQKLRDLPSLVESGKVAKPIFQDNDIVFNNWPVKPF